MFSKLFKKKKDFKPAGDPMDILEDGGSRYSTDLYNLAYQRDIRNVVNIILLCITIVSIIGLIYMGTRSTYIPYIVRVNNTTGAIDSGGPITEVKYEPKEAEIKYFLAETIQNLRGIPLDPIVYRTNYDKAQAFLTGEASQKCNELMKREGVFDNLGKNTVQVQVNSVDLMAGTDHTYVVRWTEIEFPIHGTSTTEKKFTGTFSIVVDPPKKEADFYKNPTGLKISDLSYNLENATKSDIKINVPQKSAKE